MCWDGFANQSARKFPRCRNLADGVFHQLQSNRPLILGVFLVVGISE